MTLKRVARILACVFLPTFLFVFDFYAIDAAERGTYTLMVTWQYWKNILGFTLIGSVLGAPCCVVYAVILEFLFSRKLNPGSWRAFSWSAGLGLMAGLVPGLVALAGGMISGILEHDTDIMKNVDLVALAFPALGLAVGMEMGAILKILDHLLPDKPPLTVNGR